MFMRLLSLSGFVLVTLFLTSCAGSQDGNRGCLGKICPGSTQVQSGVNTDMDNFRCAAVATPQTINPAVNNPPRAEEITTVQITASGGSGRYSIPGYVNEFSGATSISGGFFNNSNSSVVINRSVKVKDLVSGNSTSCSFSVTVRPAGSAVPSSALCSISGPDSPVLDKDISVSVNVQEIAMPYDFSSLDIGDGRVVAINRQSNTEGRSANFRFIKAGANAASVKIIKNGVTVASCSKTFSVRAAPKLEIAASSQYSLVGNPITLTVTPKNFLKTPSLTFTSDKSGISISQSGLTASVASANPQAVKITVQGVDGDESASASIYLYFGSTDSAALNCHIAATKIDNNKYSFKVVASQTGEALTVTEFLPGEGGALQTPVGVEVTALYSTAGFKVISAKAHSSANAAKLCNAGESIMLSLQLEPAAQAPVNFGCSLVTAPNPVSAGGWAVATVLPIGATGQTQLESVTSSGGTEGSVVGLHQKNIYFPNAGVFPVTATIREIGSGRTASCSTTQVVGGEINRPTLCSARFLQNGFPVTQVRARESLDLAVQSTLPQGLVRFMPGAEVFSAPVSGFTRFPTTSLVQTRYKNPGLVNAGVYVSDTTGTKHASCNIPLVVTAPLSCSINATAFQNFEVHTDINPDVPAASYPSATLAVPVTIATENAKSGLAYQVKRDGVVVSDYATPTLTFTEHGRHLVEAKVTDSLDTVGAVCSTFVHVNKRQRVTIGKGRDGSSDRDKAHLTIMNRSDKNVVVRFTTITRDIAINTGSHERVVTLIIPIPAGQSVNTPEFKRSRDAYRNFDFTLEVSADQPLTDGKLIPVVNAIIGGHIRTFTLGAM